MKYRTFYAAAVCLLCLTAGVAGASRPRTAAGVSQTLVGYNFTDRKDDVFYEPGNMSAGFEYTDSEMVEILQAGYMNGTSAFNFPQRQCDIRNVSLWEDVLIDAYINVTFPGGGNTKLATVKEVVLNWSLTVIIFPVNFTDVCDEHFNYTYVSTYGTNHPGVTSGTKTIDCSGVSILEVDPEDQFIEYERSLLIREYSALEPYYSPNIFVYVSVSVNLGYEVHYHSDVYCTDAVFEYLMGFEKPYDEKEETIYREPPPTTTEEPPAEDNLLSTVVLVSAGALALVAISWVIYSIILRQRGKQKMGSAA